MAHVSCGVVARNLWCTIVSPDNGDELPDGRVGEVWLHGDNVGRGYWNRPAETHATFGARLRSRLASGSRAEGVPVGETWLRSGDLGTYHDGELYIMGRRADLITVEGRDHQPQDVEATAADAATLVRRGYVAAFTVPAAGDGGDGRLVIVAERAAGTARIDPSPSARAIRDAVSASHGVPVADVQFVPAGAIPRTTSGKLARRAAQLEYLGGGLRT